MILSTKMMLWFGAVWFGGKLFDFIVPLHNPTFNAALAIAAMLCCAADHIEAVLAESEAP